MKKTIAAALILTTTTATASDIMLSKSIKPALRHNIEKDLNLIENFRFSQNASAETLKVMGLSSLNAESATDWLNDRVSYIVSEKALSLYSLLVKRVIFVDQKDVEFPNQNIIPYSIDKLQAKEESFTVMSNIGAALYIGGKKEKQVYGMRVSRGLLRKAEKVAVKSPRAGIIQIGEGLFAPELTVNNSNPESMANSIFRLGTFFHEARHSDGNGKSLSFLHISCPTGHDYEGQPACDENLNGPYTIGTVMMAEMSKACDETCSEKDKETLKILVLDSANRILTKTHKGEKSTVWDANPEGI
ncbi:MAG: hypothetical protein WC635_10730 [Bacteriovorax sp.]|jgi:hypothetical protein